MKFAVGQKVGHFKVLRRYEIEPTMETYIAEDLVLGREVLFTTHPSVTERSKHALSDLQNTVRAIAALSHPNLVPIFEVFETDGRLVVISETMDGTRLDQLIEDGSLSLNQALDLAIQICSGLSAAHKAGVAHGSISATAISVDHESRAQLAAFVRARLRILGGDESPTGKGGGPISKEQDIQDMGELLRLMLDQQIRDSKDEDQPILIDTITISTAGLRKVIRKASREPEKSGYRTVDELLGDLRRVRAELSLRRGDDQLREVFEDAVIGLYRTTPDGRVVMVNRSLLRMMGFDSIDELASLDLNKSGYAKGYSRAEYIERIERDGAVTGLESAWLAKDGHPVYVRESGRVIKDRTGRVLYYEGTVENISERKHMEDAYRTLVDHSLQGLLILQDGRVVFANDTFARMIGYSVEELLDFDAEKSSGMLAPDHREMILQRIEKRLDGKPVPDKYEFSGRRKDGSVFWMEVYASLTQYAGKPAIQGAFIDITERKRAEEALKYRIEFKQLITDISSDFINLRSDEIDQGILNALEAIGKFAGVDRTHVFLLSEDGHTLSNTHEWCREGIEPRKPELQEIDLSTMPWAFERLSRFENISITSRDTLPAKAANERATMTAIGTRSYIAVPLRLEDRLLGIVGFDSVRAEKTWTEEIVSPLTIVAQILTNVLERRRAEDRLRRSESNYRAVVEDQTELICRYDTEMIITFVNEAYCRFVGKSREELLGGWFLSRMPEEERERLAKIIRGLTAEQAVATVEHSMVSDSGETFWLQWTNRALLDEKGRIIEYQSVGRDLTGRKRVEEMLRITTRELKVERQSLTEKNIALKQILDHIENERQDYKQRICQDVETALTPFLATLKEVASRSGLADVEALEVELNSILTRDIDVFKDRYASLTSREIEVCELIKEGFSSKQIADQLNLSLFTVHKHREQIRRKLRIRNKSVNLSTYLKSH